MTKKHDEKVAAEVAHDEHEADLAKRKDDEKRLKKAGSKVSKVSKLQVAAHILEGKD